MITLLGAALTICVICNIVSAHSLWYSYRSEMETNRKIQMAILKLHQRESRSTEGE
jgi:hypothetical protein